MTEQVEQPGAAQEIKVADPVEITVQKPGASEVAMESPETAEAKAEQPKFKYLVTDEVALTDGTETVWRQCAPGHFDKRTGKPSDEMFRATDADQGKMSGARSSKATAEQAYKHRTDVLKKPSAGTWGVSVAEIEKVHSRAVDDSKLQAPPPPEPPPGHTYIDVRHLDELDKEGRRKFRSTLLIFANKRTRQFPAPQ